MSAQNKAKGTLFESQVAEWLQGRNVRAKRLPRTGVNDIGDVAFPMTPRATVVLECKNVKTITLSEFLRQADVEAVNYEKKYPAEGCAFGAAVVKRRGKNAGESYVVMPLYGFVELLQELGAV